MRHALSSLLAAAAITAGCGGNVLVDSTGSGGTGNTGAGGIGGFGGIGGTGGTGNTGGVYPACGGDFGSQCPPDMWCDYADGFTCGDLGVDGTCMPKPSGCPADCPGVCGCDGFFYCNACGAQQAGVDVDTSLDCGATMDEYSATYLPTGAIRYAIFKAEPAEDRCLVIVVGTGSGIPGVDITMGWGVENVIITPSAKDCAIGSDWWPPAIGVKTDLIKGSIKHDNIEWPCAVSVDVVVGFPPGGPSWVPAEDFMKANSVTIAGGCEL